MTGKVNLNPFNTVAPNTLATVQYNGSGTSTPGIVLKMSGGPFDETHINSVSIEGPGGKPIIPPISGSRLRAQLEYDGYAWAAGFLPIYFADLKANTRQAKYLGNFDHTIYQGPMTIKVDIGAAVAPILSAFTVPMLPKIAMGYKPADAVRHRMLIQTIKTYAAAVTDEPIPMSIGTAGAAEIKKIFFHHTGAMISLEVVKQSIAIYESVSQAESDFINDEMFDRVKQTNLLVWDPIASGDYSELVKTVRKNRQAFDFQFKPAVNAPETITAYADVIAPLGIT